MFYHSSIGGTILDFDVKRDLGFPSIMNLKIDETSIVIDTFDANKFDQSLNNQLVNIFASGPSIANLIFDERITSSPSIFVNGSLSLTSKHSFSNIVGYVISDPRFIRNNPEILTQHYKGQPLYATTAVYEALSLDLPEIIYQYHDKMKIIFPANRKLDKHINKSWLTLLPIIKRFFGKKIPLSKLINHPSFVIDLSHQPEAIGVSLDVTNGFIEAGTVSYIAAQLAFSRQASDIHLYGIDLLNSNKPRFYENSENSAPSKLDKAIFERIVPSFNLLGSVYKKMGVSVINHSLVSKKLFDFD